MASSLLSAGKPFLLQRSPSPPSLSVPRRTLAVSRGNSLRVAAVAQKWEPSKVVPQADRVLVRLERLPEKSAGGVLLPKSAVKFERYLMGEVLSVGADVGEVEAGKKYRGSLEDTFDGMSLNCTTNKVIFSDINAYEVDLGSDAKHCFCRAGDLLAVVE